MSSKREETIELAVRFLKDPKVQQSTLAKRIAFLESKGLTAEEIEDAVNRANASDSTSKPTTTAATSSTPVPQASPNLPSQQQQVNPPLPPGGPQAYMPYQQPYPGQPMYGTGSMYGPGPVANMPPQGQMTWKDYTLGAIGVAAVGYGLFELGKRYVAPYLIWPTEAKLAADQKKIEEQLSAATAAVKEAREGAELLVKDVEGQSAKIGSALDNLRDLVKEIQQADEKRDAEIKSIKSDVDTIRDMLPKIIEKAKEAQGNAMNDLHNEVKSLKNLLLNRRVGGGPSAPSGSSIPSTSAPQIVSSGEEESKTQVPPPSVSATPGLGGIGVTKPLPFGKPVGIPAWQLASASSAPAPAAPAAAPTNDEE
ncbi:peroxisomal membrane protein pex14 [Phlyctochytrium planicorne]|nr:peroxisomal membrane protein pex14 [Phlyctochytrium planicorne]